jgi:glutathione S-transferase
VKLYDAPRCPFCGRVRIALAEKAIPYEPVEIDLGNRPDWLYELNALGKVPVLQNGFALPESAVILEYLDECHSEHPLLPAHASDRARARLQVFRFDETLGDSWYAFRRSGERADVEARLAEVPVGESLFVDIAYAPWLFRARELYGLELGPRVEAWLEDALTRPAFAAELELVRSLA